MVSKADGEKDGDEDLRLADFAGSPVDDRHGLARVVVEQLVACAMFLAHT